jgi:hypothetical protein
VRARYPLSLSLLLRERPNIDTHTPSPSVILLQTITRVHNSRREQERVKAAGGRVTNISIVGSGPSDDPRSGLGPLRIWPGGVANARSIGDFDVGGLLIPCPHITQLRMPREGGRVVIASDGVWDSVDLHRCAKVARPYAAPEAAERIVTQSVRTQGKWRRWEGG